MRLSHTLNVLNMHGIISYIGARSTLTSFFFLPNYSAIPPDYTCVVKNQYVPPHYAYPVEVHAIAGTNTFSPNAFTFDLYRLKNSNFLQSLPRDAFDTVKDYGRVLSLPAVCDKKSSSRFGVVSCLFAGDDFIDPLEIPTIVNPVSGINTPNHVYHGLELGSSYVYLVTHPPPGFQYTTIGTCRGLFCTWPFPLSILTARIGELSMDVNTMN